MNVFCPRCGKEGELIDGLCVTCFSAKKDPLFLKRTEFEKCPDCGRFRGELEDVIRRNIRHAGKISDIRIIAGEDNVHVDAKLLVGGVELCVSKDFEIRIKKALCERCIKIRGGYYETTVQMRGSWQRMEKYIESGKLSKTEARKEGPDLFFPSNTDAEKLARIAKRKFKAEIIRTRTLSGIKEGRKVYKITILIRV